MLTIHPNFLWHIDTNMKLHHWRMCIHGCIDGFSHCIIFLCVNNNRAPCFLKGNKQIGISIQSEGWQWRGKCGSWKNSRFGTEERTVAASWLAPVSETQGLNVYGKMLWKALSPFLLHCFCLWKHTVYWTQDVKLTCMPFIMFFFIPNSEAFGQICRKV